MHVLSPSQPSQLKAARSAAAAEAAELPVWGNKHCTAPGFYLCIYFWKVSTMQMYFLYLSDAGEKHTWCVEIWLLESTNGFLIRADARSNHALRTCSDRHMLCNYKTWKKLCCHKTTPLLLLVDFSAHCVVRAQNNGSDREEHSQMIILVDLSELWPLGTLLKTLLYLK